MQAPNKAELLEAEVDEQDENFFRILVDGRFVKYLTVESGLFSVEDMCFGPSLIKNLPDFPLGGWNDGLVSRDAKTGQPHFARTVKTQFPGVENLWHDTRVDYCELVLGQKLRTGIYEVKFPIFETAAVAKFARFDWQIQYLENETTAYQWIEGGGIGPRFLGHLTEHGRVIGFLMERITGTRHAGPQDLEACSQELSRLQSLGIRHGDVNRFNFLIRDSGAVIINFDPARMCDDQAALSKELDTLRGSLQDQSTSGGGGLT